MRFTIKLNKDSFGYAADLAIRNGDDFEALEVDGTLGRTLRNCKRVEVSTEYFSGSTKKEVKTFEETDLRYAGFEIDGNWICSNWACKLGLDKVDYVYVKVRR